MNKRKLETAGEIVSSMTDAEAEALKVLLQQMPPAVKDAGAALLERLQAAYQAYSQPHRRVIKTFPATDFQSVTQAADALVISYDPFSEEYLFLLKETSLGQKDARPLSTHFAAVIKELQQSPYVRKRFAETLPRMLLELILVDRLRSLEDKDAHNQLCFSAEVPVSVRTQDIDGNDELVRGRADWALGYGRNKADTGSILIVIEAKPEGKASVGLPQLLVCMAAVFESRRYHNNNTVFGMMSDASRFEFAFLDHDKKLYVSSAYRWSADQSTIIAHIDTILLEAIRSSPNMTPDKVRNRTISNYSRYRKERWRFGEDAEDIEEDEEDEDDDYVNIIKDKYRLTLRTAREYASYRSRFA